MLITPEKIEAMFIAYSVAWQAGFEAAEVWSDKISMEAPSITETNTYAFMSQMPRMKEWLSERQVEALAAYSYSLKNRDWESTVSVPRNKLDDDQYGVYKPVFADYGNVAAKWPDDMLLEVLQNAESLVCFDGQPFFDDEHPVDPYDSAKGTYANLLTTRPLTPENYAFARRSMRLFKGDNGRPANVRPTMLVVPPPLEDKAKRILQSEDLAVSSQEGNTIVGSQTNIYKGTAELLVIDELGDTLDWYLLCTNRPVKPFVKQIRKAPVFQRYFNPADPNLFLLKEYIMGADSRGNAGVTLPFLAMKCKAA